MLAILLLVRVTAHGAASIDDVVSVAGVTYTLLKNTDTSAKGFECVDSDVYCGKRSCKPPHPSDNPPCNITAIALTCSTTPHCTGFNSDGWLKPCVTKSCGARQFPFEGVDTYVRSSSPPAPDSPVDKVDDWHYPAEEPEEMAAIAIPRLLNITAAMNLTGVVTLSIDGEVIVFDKIGSSHANWTLTGLVIGNGRSAGDLAVFERSSTRWGLFGFTSTVGEPITLARTGVGLLRSIRRPSYALEAHDKAYFSKARLDPGDYIKKRFLNASRFGEADFAAAASFLPPAKDYALIGNVNSHTKFSVSQDGRVRLANGSIYSAMEFRNITSGNEPGLMLFDPRDYVPNWPVTNFSDYKSSIIGRYSRAIHVAAYDVATDSGFRMIAVPNIHRGIDTQPYDPSELLVRLEILTVNEDDRVTSTTFRYFSVSSGNPWIRNSSTPPPKPRELANGGLFYANLYQHLVTWDDFFQGGMQLSLAYDGSEGSRLVDMSKAVISTAMTTYVGLRPNYGSGSNYWSVAQKDRGSLPLESFALITSLIFWGHESAAAERVEYYLNTYVRAADGLTPLEHPGMNRSLGQPGTIDLKHWEDECWFADGLSDYGRWLDLWVMVARRMEAAGNFAWVSRTFLQVKLMAKYIGTLIGNMPTKENKNITMGLIYGSAEHDTCRYESHWFSVNSWAWRGLVELKRFLNDTSVVKDPQTAKAASRDIRQLGSALSAATELSLIAKDGKPYFLPPYLAANFTPYDTMIDSGPGGGASYANFRYFAEMLSSGYFNRSVEIAINDFRESHTGTLSGMTRFRDHLDDMPAAGYALSSISLDRIESFLALLFGHMANYHSRGTYNAPEQLSLYGDGIKGRFTYSDSYRGMLSMGRNEVDIDDCVPSTTLPSYMTKLMVLFEERDCDLIWFLRAAPRRFYAPNTHAVALKSAPTRYGELDFALNISTIGGFDARVGWRLHGKGFIDGTNRKIIMVFRLRDVLGVKVVGAATITSGRDCKVVSAPERDTVAETVSLVISAADKAEGSCDFTASLQ